MVNHTGQDISYNVVAVEESLTRCEEDRILKACRRAKSLREGNAYVMFRAGKMVLAEVSSHHSKVMGK